MNLGSTLIAPTPAPLNGRICGWLSTAGGGWVQSPLRPDGIGTIVFSAANESAGDTNALIIETSTNGTVWTGVQTVTNTTTTYTEHTVSIDVYGALYVRIRMPAPAPDASASTILF